jgi:hypothetical protein
LGGGCKEGQELRAIYLALASVDKKPNPSEEEERFGELLSVGVIGKIGGALSLLGSFSLAADPAIRAGLWDRALPLLAAAKGNAEQLVELVKQAGF